LKDILLFFKEYNDPSIELVRKITVFMMMYGCYGGQPLVVDEIEF
jgi:hypothetical protein